MGYLDRIAVPPSAHGRFPWEIAAAERPELVTLVRVLIAHGLLATGEAACAACGRQGTPAAPLTLHHDVPVSRGDTPPAVAELAALCPACHRCAHSRTPPLLAVELCSLRERAAAGKRQP